MNNQTNWKFIGIVVVLAVIVGGGILCYFKDFTKELISITQFPEIKKSKKHIEDEIAKWNTYSLDYELAFISRDLQEFPEEYSKEEREKLWKTLEEMKECNFDIKYPKDWVDSGAFAFHGAIIPVGFGIKREGADHCEFGIHFYRDETFIENEINDLINAGAQKSSVFINNYPAFKLTLEENKGGFVKYFPKRDEKSCFPIFYGYENNECEEICEKMLSTFRFLEQIIY